MLHKGLKYFLTFCLLLVGSNNSIYAASDNSNQEIYLPENTQIDEYSTIGIEKDINRVHVSVSEFLEITEKEDEEKVGKSLLVKKLDQDSTYFIENFGSVSWKNDLDNQLKSKALIAISEKRTQPRTLLFQVFRL